MEQGDSAMDRVCGSAPYRPQPAEGASLKRRQSKRFLNAEEWTGGEAVCPDEGEVKGMRMVEAAGTTLIGATMRESSGGQLLEVFAGDAGMRALRGAPR